MRRATVLLFFVASLFQEGGLMAEQHQHAVDVDAMVRVLFTGDSQSCGRNLALDFPQLLSRRLPVRAINTAVGGSNSSAQLRPMKSGTVRATKGERVVYGTNVRWGTGPFPGCKVTVNGRQYTIDHIVEHPGAPHTELGLVEPIEADYEGPDCRIEPCWEYRVAAFEPDVVAMMYINDGTMPSSKQDDWRELIRRIRGLGAVPVIMAPFPVDGRQTGGNHPGDYTKVIQNADAVRELATTEGCWFVDNFRLNLMLDPPLRGLLRDGIHPDTDGQQATVDGLMWIFEAMGLAKARPMIKGWILTGRSDPSADAFDREQTRPFRTAQPDHPDPDHQVTEGFTIDAFRRNDEYNLISRAGDGYALEVEHGVKFSVGFAKGADLTDVTLHVTGSGLRGADAWDPAARTWTALTPVSADDGIRIAIPGSFLDHNMFTVILRPGAKAEIDYVRATANADTPAPVWQPRPHHAFYELRSDHGRPDNLVRDAGFTGAASAWTLAGGAWLNQPFTADLGGVAFPDEKDRRLAEFATPGRTRPYDLLTVSGSAGDNDGNYRVLRSLGGGRFVVRRRSHGPETGLHGAIAHNDGCGLVAGGGCVEIPTGGSARQVFELPSRTRYLSLSLFHRAYEPDATGTRDLPQASTRVEVRFLDKSGAPFDAAPICLTASASYQWRKLKQAVAVPERAAHAELLLVGAKDSVRQFTGVWVSPAPLTNRP